MSNHSQNQYDDNTKSSKNNPRIEIEVLSDSVEEEKNNSSQEVNKSNGMVNASSVSFSQKSQPGSKSGLLARIMQKKMEALSQQFLQQGQQMELEKADKIEKANEKNSQPQSQSEQIKPQDKYSIKELLVSAEVAQSSEVSFEIQNSPANLNIRQQRLLDHIPANQQDIYSQESNNNLFGENSDKENLDQSQNSQNELNPANLEDIGEEEKSQTDNRKNDDQEIIEPLGNQQVLGIIQENHIEGNAELDKAQVQIEESQKQIQEENEKLDEDVNDNDNDENNEIVIRNISGQEEQDPENKQIQADPIELIQSNDKNLENQSQNKIAKEIVNQNEILQDQDPLPFEEFCRRNKEKIQKMLRESKSKKSSQNNTAFTDQNIDDQNIPSSLNKSGQMKKRCLEDNEVSKKPCTDQIEQNDDFKQKIGEVSNSQQQKEKQNHKEFDLELPNIQPEKKFNLDLPKSQQEFNLDLPQFVVINQERQEKNQLLNEREVVSEDEIQNDFSQLLPKINRNHSKIVPTQEFQQDAALREIEGIINTQQERNKLLDYSCQESSILARITDEDSNSQKQKKPKQKLSSFIQEFRSKIQPKLKNFSKNSIKGFMESKLLNTQDPITRGEPFQEVRYKKNSRRIIEISSSEDEMSDAKPPQNQQNVSFTITQLYEQHQHHNFPQSQSGVQLVIPSQKSVSVNSSIFEDSNKDSKNNHKFFLQLNQLRENQKQLTEFSFPIQNEDSNNSNTGDQGFKRKKGNTDFVEVQNHELLQKRKSNEVFSDTNTWSRSVPRNGSLPIELEPQLALPSQIQLEGDERENFQNSSYFQVFPDQNKKVKRSTSQESAQQLREYLEQRQKSQEQKPQPVELNLNLKEKNIQDSDIEPFKANLNKIFSQYSTTLDLSNSVLFWILAQFDFKIIKALTMISQKPRPYLMFIMGFLTDPEVN